MRVQFGPPPANKLADLRKLCCNRRKAAVHISGKNHKSPKGTKKGAKHASFQIIVFLFRLLRKEWKRKETFFHFCKSPCYPILPLLDGLFPKKERNIRKRNGRYLLRSKQTDIKTSFTQLPTSSGDSFLSASWIVFVARTGDYLETIRFNLVLLASVLRVLKSVSQAWWVCLQLLGA